MSGETPGTIETAPSEPEAPVEPASPILHCPPDPDPDPPVPGVPEPPRPVLRPTGWVFWTAVGFTLVLDQVTKIVVDAAGDRYHRNVIPGLFDIKYVENHGGAWGLFSDASESFRMPFFIVTSILAIGFLLFLRSRLHLRRSWTGWAFPLILGGAIGNLVDRIRMGYVIDFLEFYVKSAHWPTFNVADIGITIGVGLLLLDSILPARGGMPEPVEPATTTDPVPEPTTTTTTTTTGE